MISPQYDSSNLRGGPQYDHTDLSQLNNFRFHPNTIVPTYGAGRASRTGYAARFSLGGAKGPCHEICH
jgi:hypothetical protein